jgi:hypothetical protein
MLMNPTAGEELDPERRKEKYTVPLLVYVRAPTGVGSSTAEFQAEKGAKYTLLLEAGQPGVSLAVSLPASSSITAPHRRVQTRGRSISLQNQNCICPFPKWLQDAARYRRPFPVRPVCASTPTRPQPKKCRTTTRRMWLLGVVVVVVVVVVLPPQPSLLIYLDPSSRASNSANRTHLPHGFQTRIPSCYAHFALLKNPRPYPSRTARRLGRADKPPCETLATC